MKLKRKGFTLAELLIVITVIGVLASMMMVSSNEAVSTSRATDIMANLRALKGAALMHYVDSYDVYSKTNRAEDTRGTNFNISLLTKYVDVPDLSENGYKFVEDEDTGRWYVGYVFNMNDSDIKPKLAARAKALGLLNATESLKIEESAGSNTSSASTSSESDGQNKVDDAKYYAGSSKAIALQVR